MNQTLNGDGLEQALAEDADRIQGDRDELLYRLAWSRCLAWVWSQEDTAGRGIFARQLGEPPTPRSGS